MYAVDAHTHIFTDHIRTEYAKRSKHLRVPIRKAIVIDTWTKREERRWPLQSLVDHSLAHPELYIIAVYNIFHPWESQRHIIDSLSTQKRIVGIKVMLGYQPIRANDCRLDPVAQYCIDTKRVLLLHTGCVNAREGELLEDADVRYVDELAVRYPELKIVIAHLGFPDLRRAFAIIDKNKNVYGDISGTIDNQGTPSANQALTLLYAKDLLACLTYFPTCARKIMFGTDYCGEHTSLNLVGNYQEVVEKIARKDPSARSAIYRDTAEQVYSI
jgi:predicted TIM-barrel fold metal-dependent hydrolase